MLDKIDPTSVQSWKNLTDHFDKMKNIHMKDLFIEDPQRFNKFSVRFNDILVDYSKHIITEETIKLLTDLADEINLKDAIEKMFT